MNRTLAPLALVTAAVALAGCASAVPETVELRASSTGGVADLELSIGGVVTTEELGGDWTITLTAEEVADAKLTVTAREDGLDQIISCEMIADGEQTGYVENHSGARSSARSTTPVRLMCAPSRSPLRG